jgi:hypothetical protein
MNIFLSFLQSENRHPIPAYDFWEHYIKNGITEAGYQWSECTGADWALGLVPQSKDAFLKWKQDTWEKTIDCIKKHPPDVFLSYLYPTQIDISAIKEIQKAGIPCVNFFCDNVRDFTKLPVEFEVFDLNWVPEYKAAQWYKAAGYNYINLPMPIWVDQKYRVLKNEVKKQVTFIGSMDIQRLLLFEDVAKQASDLPLAIYGSGWLEPKAALSPVAPDYTLAKKVMFNLNMIRQLGMVPYWRKIQQRAAYAGVSGTLKNKVFAAPAFDRYNSLTAQSMITVGVNRYPSFHFPFDKPDSYSRLRDIEAPMLGACYLTEYTDGIEDLYDIKKEIAVYRTAEELISKTRELQADHAKRRQLKINGQKRALKEHNIPNSLNRILKRILH